ncbi:ABC transporter permease/M1 family aminopeptidase [Agaribacter flavus]|uniref:M1 family aminopeptidase n=1 Tax=Agaribacter flavus TaxID=1902781 RepID=A0ABV7FM53_9ALTE
MFAKMLIFEWRFYLKQPSFIVTSLLFFLLPFLSMSVEGVQLGTNTNVNFNSPFAIAQSMLIFAIFGMFLVVNFVGNTALRDQSANMDEILYCKPIPSLSYQLGRFFGSYLVVLTVFSMVPLGLVIGSLMPWIDQERMGAFNLMYFIQPFAAFSVTTMFVLSAIFYAAAIQFRNIMAVYLSALLMFIVYISIDVLLDAPDERYLLAVSDPFGVRTHFDLTRYWTPSERNTQMLGWHSEIFVNRFIWLAISISILLGFSRINQPMRLKEKQTKVTSEKTLVPKVLDAFVVNAKYTRGADVLQLFTRVELETRQIFLSPSFILLMIFCFISLFSQFLGPATFYGAESWPVTHIMISIIQNAFGLILMIILTFYTAEAVWRDHSVNMGEIVDSMPVKNSIFWLSKLIAVSLVILCVLMIGIVSAALYQFANGYFALELAQYFISLFYFYGLPLVYLCVLSFFIQVLSPNKYVGMLIFVAYMLLSFTFSQIGIEHNMFNFSLAPTLTYSDMNTYGWAMLSQHYYMLYWGALSLILAVFSHALWKRGSESKLAHRLQLLNYRLDGNGRFMIVVASIVFVGCATVIHYNTRVINKFETRTELFDRQAKYEKKYQAFEDADLPTVTAIDVNAAIFPKMRKMEVMAEIEIQNKTEHAIERFLINLPLHSYDIQFDFDGVNIELDDDDLNTAWFAFSEALQPGESVKGSVSLVRQHFGFKDRDEDVSLVKNGTFINNMQLLPVFGVNKALYLQDKHERRKRGLAPPKRAHRLENSERYSESFFGAHTGRIKFRARLSTSEEQIAIAPGKLKDYWVENGRNHFVYEMDKPMIPFFSISSADVEVKSTIHQGIEISVYYHRDHAWNIDTMIKAVKDAIDLYTEAFGPYQHSQLRIIEFPGYRNFAQSFANTVPYSETVGFISDLRDKNVIDPVYYVTAHEVAHQWFGHQMVPANVQGGPVLTESLAQYAALLVMQKNYGETKIREFLRYELDEYLRGRTRESIEEMPLLRVENQDYIHYKKGAIVFTAIADRIGIDSLNRALFNLLERFKCADSVYPTTLDLLQEIKAHAAFLHHDFIDQQFKQITLYDISISDASASKIKDNRYRVNMSIDAKQLIVSGNGDEQSQAFDDFVDILVFDSDPDDFAGNQTVLYRKKHRLNEGSNIITFELDKQPVYVAVDPFIRFIDRESRDNVFKTENSL